MTTARGMLPVMVRALASKHLMVAFFLLMAAVALGIAYGLLTPSPAAVVPLALMAVNLTAAIASNARFRADLPLLVFHLSLLAFTGLVAIAWLTNFDGLAKVLVDRHFAGDVQITAHGALHGNGVRALRFTNEGFTETFDGSYRHTRNRVRFAAAGVMHEGVIGDDRPLVLDGYRIYTRARGYAANLQWEPDDGALQLTSVQFGPLSKDGFTQGTQWPIPGGPLVWMSLSTEKEQPGPGMTRENLGVKEARNKLVVRHDERFHDLEIGESIALPGGRLRYGGLSAWMGYRIIYDPTKPWLVGTLAVAIGSMLWFYARRLWRSWDED